ncbi:hypothetical protein CO015_04785 [candidate division WWE3 bacterium CG_4_8_14_3_um_filter_42_11]|uniref:Permease n=1 Tax=candidate division WWE3 bacterium CG_4_8_14_3_um_filter_42_11 TaxID=1975076 RepID=A0A2M8G5R4_UNCKA|nr:MAG: hypothetical protein CO015_04785 [candidate division WWE3 bacterium CG_4_8_14_3_um_filter_42_11]
MKKIGEIIRKNWVLGLLGGAYLIIYLWQESIGSLLVQENVQKVVGESIYQGWLGLVDYLSAHVLFCLIPAFFIAGAINSLIDSQSILKYLSGKTKKWLAYLIAAVGGFFIEVCSCTILPLFAGIWKKGAGLGIATTFLYAGPAINIVAFLLTGQRLGWDLATVRLILSITFAISVGLIMEFVFRNEKKIEGELVFVDQEKSFDSKRKSQIFWVTLFAILIAGTAPINSTLRYAIVIPLTFTSILITFLWLKREKRGRWWEETINFTTQIIPLLLVGVFFASFLTHLIPQEEFQRLASNNNILTNFVAVLFGSIAYFPALVEVPIAENFLRLGMNKGPLLAYLLSDPVLSLQGLLIISKLIGKKKTLVYAVSIVILTTLAGYIYGLFT